MNRSRLAIVASLAIACFVPAAIVGYVNAPRRTASVASYAFESGSHASEVAGGGEALDSVLDALDAAASAVTELAPVVVTGQRPRAARPASVASGEIDLYCEPTWNDLTQGSGQYRNCTAEWR